MKCNPMEYKAVQWKGSSAMQCYAMQCYII